MKRTIDIKFVLVGGLDNISGRLQRRLSRIAHVANETVRLGVNQKLIWGFLQTDDGDLIGSVQLVETITSSPHPRVLNTYGPFYYTEEGVSINRPTPGDSPKILTFDEVITSLTQHFTGE